MNLRELIAFQNFLILDGQLDIESDEVRRNAEIYLANNSHARLETKLVRENEHSGNVSLCDCRNETCNGTRCCSLNYPFC